jgi:alpha-tubulin suppressor-like RCC1 family protein
MPNQFSSPEGDLENYYVTESWLIDQYIGDKLFVWGSNSGGKLGTNTISNSAFPITTFAGGTNWKQVSGNDISSAAIKTDGTLWTWGGNSYGQLGNNTAISRSTPVTTFAGGTNWKQVSGGAFHTAAIKTDGTLWTWGANFYGQLGNNTTTQRNTPVTTFAGGNNWKQVAGGSAYTAAIKTDGTLWLWGFGDVGQLGNNLFANRSTPITTFAGGTNWKQVATGSAHIAAIKTDGTLWVWGRNSYGQLGDNTIINRSTPVTTFAGGTNWKQVDCGGFHTTVIKTDGTLWTWGRNVYGQLGRPLITWIVTPVTTFAGGTNWADTATGASEELYTLGGGQTYTAAVKTDGTLWVWGHNYYGNLGTNNRVLISTPVTTFAGGTNWKQVSSSSGRGTSPVSTAHMAAIKTDGTLWTWGRSNSGQLGNNNSLDRSTPITTFAGGTNWKQVACGGYVMSAIKTDGTLWVWGTCNYGKLGNNLGSNSRFTPVTTFAGGTNWKQVAGGYDHTAAIKTDGTLWVWGGGILVSGQLGDNTTISRSTPVTTFAGGTNWKQVACGANHTAAIKNDGTLWVWGLNTFGQLGDNTATQRNTPVTTFAGGTNWKQVSCGNYYTTAVKTDGTLWTWGNNGSGQLGDNTAIFNTSKSTPITTFAGGTNWTQVICKGNSTLAIKTDGTLWGWGSEYYQELGTNWSSTDVKQAQTFAGGNNWKQVSGGASNSAAIKTDGTLWVWGYNNTYQLGDNTTVTAKSTPVTTFAGGTNWKQVSCSDNTMAVTSGEQIDIFDPTVSTAAPPAPPPPPPPGGDDN